MTRQLYTARRWERRVLALALTIGAALWAVIADLFGWSGVLAVLGTGVLLATAIAHGVGAGE